MSDYDRQRDIEAEGQRASTRQPSAGGIPSEDDVVKAMAWEMSKEIGTPPENHIRPARALYKALQVYEHMHSGKVVGL